MKTTFRIVVSLFCLLSWGAFADSTQGRGAASVAKEKPCLDHRTDKAQKDPCSAPVGAQDINPKSTGSGPGGDDGPGRPRAPKAKAPTEANKAAVKPQLQQKGAAPAPTK